MKIPLIDVNLAKMPLKMPVIDDAETTRRIAEIVNERLEQIEKESNSVDTHRFALEAAMYFAAELEKAKQTYEDYVEQAKAREQEETRDVLLALTKITESLRGIVEDAQGLNDEDE